MLPRTVDLADLATRTSFRAKQIAFHHDFLLTSCVQKQYDAFTKELSKDGMDVNQVRQPIHCQIH